MDVLPQLKPKERTAYDTIHSYLFVEHKPPLTEEEQQYWDPRMILRFLRARDFKIKKTIKMIDQNIKWRASFHPREISTQQLQSFNQLHTVRIAGHDKDRRPVIYFTLDVFRAISPEIRLRYLSHVMESVTSSMDPNVESITWVCDFSAYGSKGDSREERSALQQALSALMDYYPERLGESLTINAPWYLEYLYKISRPFLAAATRNKFHFVKGDTKKIYEFLIKFIDPDQLVATYGGRMP